MKHYTLGILFNEQLTEVVLIQKKRPDWQKGKFNFPGGHVEEKESARDCVRREIFEECNVTIRDWDFVGKIINEGNYDVDIFTAICGYPNVVKSMTDEFVCWVKVSQLHTYDCISNLHWLVPFAINLHKQGNADKLQCGYFNYKY